MSAIVVSNSRVNFTDRKLISHEKRYISSRNSILNVFEARKVMNLQCGSWDIPISYIGSSEELRFHHEEIFRQQCYVKEMTLGPHHTVIDVGANVGLFSIFAAINCPGGRVISIEPIPDTYGALLWNMGSLIQANPDSSALPKVECFNFGISNGKATEAIFTHYVKGPGWSTMAPNEDEVREAMASFLDTFVSTPLPSDASILRRVAYYFRTLAPDWLFGSVASFYTEYLLGEKVEFKCKLKSISQLIQELDISHVDLLKIDVERAEMDALEGITPADWSRIQHIVVEVHDTDKQLQKVIDLLKSYGRSIKVSREESMKEVQLYLVYSSILSV